jgi:hypothetical protein
MNDTVTYILPDSLILEPAPIASWHLFDDGSSNGE